MKILIVNTSDIDGGAARAAYRLHQALLSQDIDSQMLVQNKSSDDFTVNSINKTKTQKGLAKLRPTLDALPLQFYKNKTKTLFSPANLPFSSTVDAINSLNPDIVHLHWINGGMLRIEDFSKIKAPIVWTLHDMWPFTGGCHYDEGCDLYKLKCGSCKVLQSKNKKDLSSKVLSRKMKEFSKLNDLTIIGVSKWLASCAKESIVFKHNKIINLPNTIDTNIFKPFDKEKSRNLWSLPLNVKLVLFGAMGATSDPRKGFKELAEAIRQMDVSNVEFVVFGSSKPINAPDLGCKVHYVGTLADDVSLVTLYNAVDVMIVPSLQENLSNAIMESLACATPVVGFDIGGNSDMIEHQKNGYLAKPFDTNDLANGIEWVLNNKNYDTLCQNTREKVLKEFDSVVVAKKYISLYKEILN